VRRRNKQVYKKPKLQKHSYRLPETTKALDNLYIDDNISRKAKILQQAKEIREAVSLNKASSGTALRETENSGSYSPTLPPWWG